MNILALFYVFLDPLLNQNLYPKEKNVSNQLAYFIDSMIKSCNQNSVYGFFFLSWFALAVSHDLPFAVVYTADGYYMHRSK